MKDAALNNLRQMAQIVCNPHKMPEDWECQGKWMSQRMFGITEQRAKDMASRYGGVARKMTDFCPKLSESPQ